MTVHFLPIEPMHERYSEQMLRWVQDDLKVLGVPYHTVMPSVRAPEAITHGQWLDTFGSTRWKALQLAVMASEFEAGRVLDGDVILLGDVWFPGVEALRFMAEMAGIRVVIGGWHYAGVFDPNDLLSRTLSRWSRTFEEMLLTEVLDGVCVGSIFHADMVKAKVPKARVLDIGLSWRTDASRFRVDRKERQRIVAFPHRNAPEKNPATFCRLAQELRAEFPSWTFAVSSNGAAYNGFSSPNVVVVKHESKDAYYRWLARVGVWYSAATQETFGYSMHEAIALGIPIVAPNRCSYSEMLTSDCLYDDHDGYEMLRQKMRAVERGECVEPAIELSSAWEGSGQSFIRKLLRLSKKATA